MAARARAASAFRERGDVRSAESARRAAAAAFQWNFQTPGTKVAQDVSDLLVHVEGQFRDYGRIAVPTTVIHGESDSVTSATIHSRAVTAQIAGSRLILLPGAGHMPHHMHTETVAGAIVEIVDRARGLAQAR